MLTDRPITDLDQRFSDEKAAPIPWVTAREQLEKAGVYWLSTVRPNGRPHVTTIAAVWSEDSLYFCTGPSEQKAKNIARNPHCAITTGNNAFREGLDVVIEGEAAQVRNQPVLELLADLYASKYDDQFGFVARDGAFYQGADEALVYKIAPLRGFGFGKGTYSQTRWRF